MIEMSAKSPGFTLNFRWGPQSHSGALSRGRHWGFDGVPHPGARKRRVWAGGGGGGGQIWRGLSRNKPSIIVRNPLRVALNRGFRFLAKKLSEGFWLSSIRFI